MRPVIGVVADVKPTEKHVWHQVQEKYLYAVARFADADVLMLPGQLSAIDVNQPRIQNDLGSLMRILDGVFFPGSPSNVNPYLYGHDLRKPDTLLDKERDCVSLPLIRAAIDRGIPLLGVCRGFQEINVALGGTLHQHVHEVTGLNDHRERQGNINTEYGPAHEVELIAGGILNKLSEKDRVSVNSLHHQGIDQLAPGLIIEARALDGLIEAFHVEAVHAHGGFAVAVQWHPEWRAWEDPISSALFKTFGDSARAYASRLGAPLITRNSVHPSLDD